MKINSGELKAAWNATKTISKYGKIETYLKDGFFVYANGDGQAKIRVSDHDTEGRVPVNQMLIKALPSKNRVVDISINGIETSVDGATVHVDEPVENLPFIDSETCTPNALFVYTNKDAHSLSKACVAASKDEVRPVLGCVELTVNETHRMWVGTDSYRASIGRIEANGPATTHRFVIKRAWAALVSKITASTVYCDDDLSYICFAGRDGSQIIIRTEGNVGYPSVEHIFQHYKKDTYVAFPDAVEVVDACATLSKVSNDYVLVKNMSVIGARFASDGDSSGVSKNIQVGAVDDSNEIVIGFNNTFLKEGFVGLTGKTRMCLNATGKPAFIVSDNEPWNTYVIMPKTYSGCSEIGVPIVLGEATTMMPTKPAKLARGSVTLNVDPGLPVIANQFAMLESGATLAAVAKAYGMSTKTMIASWKTQISAKA